MSKAGFCSQTREIRAFAESLGYRCERTQGGHIKFVRPGFRAVFTSGTPSDFRVLLNAKKQLLRNLKNPTHKAREEA